MASFLATALLLASVAGRIIVDESSKNFIDEYGRTRIFHGVNAVYKLPPYFPSYDSYDKDNSLSTEDAKRLRAWGFNVVRLGVLWPGVEPTRDTYNSTYLDQIEKIVSILGDEGLYVLLDMHQDLWHRGFCGEGVPDYIYDDCRANEPKGTKQFPSTPISTIEYPLDEDSNPTLDACLSKSFFTYYMTSEVSAAFQCLYDNKANTWERLAGYWGKIAARFKDAPNVLGYELINEPWMGDLYRNPRVALPDYTEKTYLQPLYEFLHKQIRMYDDEKLIFFEGLTIDYWTSGFSSAPGGAEYNNRSVYSYHIYCPMQNATWKKGFACDMINDEFFLMRKKDVQRIGSGMMMTEFGASKNIESDLIALSEMLDLTDKHLQSWIYWQYKYYSDITTCTPEGEGFYNVDGSVYQEKVSVLTRPYPQIISGKDISYQYESKSGNFFLSYTILSSKSTDYSTLLYYNKNNYPNGVKISFNDESIAYVNCDDNLIKISHTTDAESKELVIQIFKCGEESINCTCK